MAKIKLSSIGITNISGKAGGSVYSRNRGGSYVKNFSMPSNTITDARQFVRGMFGVIAGYWRTLTETQRQSFVDQAPNYPTTDVFGDAKVLSGNALHQKLNQQLLLAGLSAISEALTPQGTNPVLDASGQMTVDVTSQSVGFEFVLATDNGVANNVYILEMTPPMSPSVKNVSNRYRVIGSSVQNGGTTPLNNAINEDAFATNSLALWGLYTSKFGAPSAGDVVYLRIKAINPVTGEVSAYFYDSVIATV